MKKGLLLLLCPLILAAGFATSRATVHDPITIQAIQSSSGIGGTVQPPDTVKSVIGIITAFDTFPSGFAFYIQDPLGGPNSGIDVFTGGENFAATKGLLVGDRVQVSGRLEEFSPFTSVACFGGTTNGETEIVSLSGAFPGAGLPAVQVTKLSSGNPLPPFKVGTVTELKENCTNSGAEQWEGTLVDVSGPMRVTRTAASAGSTGGLGTFRAALVVNNTLCPPSTPAGTVCDSFFIDLSTLANPAVEPGVVGQLVDFARGVFNSRSRGYRVQVRNGNDYGLQAAPKVARAYATLNNRYRIIFDRDALILGTTTFSLGSFGSVDAVTQIDGTTIDLTVSGTGLTPGDNESVTVTNIASASNPSLVETSAQLAEFRFGIVSPALIQQADADSLSQACHDVSQYLRTQRNTTFRGVCTARFDNLYYIQGSTGLRDAIAVFAPPVALVVGRQYVLVGGVTQERFDETQMSQILYVADEGPVSLPTPIVQSIPTLISVAPCVPMLQSNVIDESGGKVVAGPGPYAEDFESMLVKTTSAKVVTATGTAPAGGFFDVAGPGPAYADSINVDDDGTQTYTPVFNNILDITGILHFSFGEFRLQPRDDGDIFLVSSDVSGRSENVSFSLTSNPARTPRVEFSLAREGEIELSVFDVTGRKVQTLARGTYAPGSYSETWNGRDSGGRTLGAGVYFYRLVAGSETREIRGVKLN